MEYVGMCSLKGYDFLAILVTTMFPIKLLVYSFFTHLNLGMFIKELLCHHYGQATRPSRKAFFNIINLDVNQGANYKVQV